MDDGADDGAVRPVYLAALALLLLTGSFFMFYRLGSSPPPYPRPEEATAGRDALLVLREGPRLSFPDEGAGGVLWVYASTAAVASGGAKLLSLRFLSSLFGLLSIVGCYLLARQLAAPSLGGWARWAAVVAALLQATSVWHLWVSRVAWPPALVPFLNAFAFYFLWRGLNTGARWSFGAAGVFTGLSLYAYMGPVLPPMLLLFFAVEWGAARAAGRKSLAWEHKSGLLVMLAAFLVMSLPLAVYVLGSPAAFFDRASRASSLSENLGTPAEVIKLGIIATLGRFGLSSDLSQWLHTNPTGLLLGVVVTVLLWVGAALALWRAGRPEYLFLVVWFAILLVPSILLPPVSPLDPTVARRGLGVSPAVFILAALPLVEAARFARGRAGRGSPSLWGAALFGAALVWGIVSGYGNFLAWEKSEADSLLYVKEGAYNLVGWMNRTGAESGGDTVFVFPARATKGSTTRPWLYTVGFLYEHGEDAPFVVFSDNEALPPDPLYDAIEGKRRVMVVTHSGVPVDPKGYVDSLLRCVGATLSASEAVDGFDVAVYTLPGAPPRRLCGQEMPLFIYGQVPFEADAGAGTQDVQMELVGGECGSAAARGCAFAFAGDEIWAALEWQAADGPDADYQASLFLRGDSGQVVATSDRRLMSNLYYEGTSKWEEGQREKSYHLLAVPPDVPPGDYTIGVVLYDASSGERLRPVSEMAAGDLSLPLGSVDLAPPRVPADPASVAPSHPLEPGDLRPDLHLLGYDVSPGGAVVPGDALDLTLYWHAPEKPRCDYLLSIALRAGGRDVVLLEGEHLLGERYPASQWREGETMRGWYSLRLPPETPGGEHPLYLGVSCAGSGAAASTVQLAAVEVRSRERLFEPPPMQVPLEADFEGKIALLGYDLAADALAPGAEVTLTLYWKALARVEESYTVFVHVVDGGGDIAMQQDVPPQVPTPGWVEGEIVPDAHRMTIPPDLEPGRYEVRVGLYDPATGRRLAVGAGGAGFVSLGYIGGEP